MSQKRKETLEPRIVQALNELTILIRTRYPDAQFEIGRGMDDAEAIHLTTTVDIEEPEDVVDLVIDRLLELQVDERLPIHVIPLRPPERVIVEEHPSISHPGAVADHAPQP
jgi:hypothetical protein